MNMSNAETPPSICSKFYRYEAVQYASLSNDGDYETLKIPNPKMVLRTYNLWKETPKGYWIGYGTFNVGNLRSNGRWVSKTSKKRYAYPTEKEALVNFIKRNERRIEILNYNVWSCELAVKAAKNML